MNNLPMHLALHLRVGDTSQRIEEKSRRIDMDERDVVGLAEHPHHFIGLVKPHQPVIDENASELFADRLVDENSGNRGINTPRKPADHPVEAHLLLDLGDHLGPE